MTDSCGNMLLILSKAIDITEKHFQFPVFNVNAVKQFF